MTAKQRKAISPAIATVMLLAVTLVVVLALGSFVFGIFNTSTQSANVSIVTTSYAGNTLSITFRNTGSSADTVNNVYIPGNSPQTLNAGNSTSAVVPANTPTITIQFPSAVLTAGQTYSMTVHLASGTNLPYQFSA